MPVASTRNTLERVLGAVGECLDRSSAEAILRLRADAELQARIEDLADRNTEGELTPDEREEYESLVRVGNFIAILQAKARRVIGQEHAA